MSPFYSSGGPQTDTQVIRRVTNFNQCWLMNNDKHVITLTSHTISNAMLKKNVEKIQCLI